MRMSYEFTLVRAAIEESPQDLWCRSTVSGIKRASQSDTVLPPCGRPAHSPDHEEQPVTVIPTNQPVWPGRPRPLGATWDGEGTNFAVFAEEAEAVELCLFDERGAERRLELPEVTAHTWHGYVPGIGPDQRYGFRVHGPFDPRRGLRFNPAKLLLDPYARAIEGMVDWDGSVFGYRVGADDLVADDRDSAPHVPKSVVVHEGFPWGDDRRPVVPWADTVIYEAHVRGFTIRHPGIAEHERGTYAGMGSPPVVEHLRRLGVTTVELQPVHHFISEHQVVRRGQTNYWGYNSIVYFAPEARYSSTGRRGQQVREFKAMVRNLHTAGIEVILDVVYNHTAEGGALGPTLSFRGIDNRSYYRLDDANPRAYVDYSGTGNTLNVRHPQVLALIMDSLRYWVLEMHVDGFRFELASALARGFHEVDRLSAFFDLIHQDPVISQVKLIAEPWDVGEGGYQVGNFPVLWTEWNGRYRDTIRDFWRGARTGVADLAYRLTGSSDLYQSDGRRPYASINFVTAHDGFTLHDLVSYDHKHNQANGEDNRDGSDDNRSCNFRVEAPTDDPEVLALRERQKRNLLATLLLSTGVPMLLAGAHPVFRRRRFFQGQALRGSGVKDIGWFTSDGAEMDEARWRAPDIATLGVFLNGEEIHDLGPRGERIVDDSFLLLIHGGAEAEQFTLPGSPWAKEYELVLDTATDPAPPDTDARHLPAGEQFLLPPRSYAVLRKRS